MWRRRRRGFREWRRGGGGGRGARCGFGLVAAKGRRSVGSCRAGEVVVLWEAHPFVVFGFYPIELLAVVGQLGAEVLDALVGLFLLGGDHLLLCQAVVVIYSAVEGSKGGVDLPCALVLAPGSGESRGMFERT